MLSDSHDWSKILPSFSRARGYYLYSSNGKRYSDFWQYDGLAILGHKPQHVSRSIKQALDKGLWIPFSTPQSSQFIKAFQTLFPCSSIISSSSRLKDIQQIVAQREGKSIPLVDSLDSPPSSESILLWRPFLDISPEALAKHPYFVPLLPLPWGPPLYFLCQSKPADSSLCDLSPVLLAALQRCIYNIVHHTKKEIPSADFREGSLWKKKGPYLIYRGSHKYYPTLFSRCLSCGIIISPYPSVAIIPLTATLQMASIWNRAMT